MLIFRPAGEQLMSTFGTNIHACRRNTDTIPLAMSNMSQSYFMQLLSCQKVTNATIQLHALFKNLMCKIKPITEK